MRNCYKCNGKEYILKKRNPQNKEEPVPALLKIPCKVCLYEREKLYPFDNLPKTFSALNKQTLQSIEFTIVGAGIAGVAVAIVLLKLGFSVTIIEKDDSFDSRRQGYGLTIQQASKSLRELGVEISLDTISTTHYVFTEKGEILGYFGSNFSKYFQRYLQGEKFEDNEKIKQSTKYAGKGNYNAHIPLRKLLLDKLMSIETRCLRLLWRTSFVNLEPTGKRVKICMGIEGDQNFLETDFLLACDGIYSSVREQVEPQKLSFLHCVVILGISDYQHPLLPKRVFETNDGETRLYVMPFKNVPLSSDISNPALVQLESYTTMWQLSFKVSTEAEAKRISSSAHSLIEEALRRCAHWHEPVPELIKHTEVGRVSGHPVYDRPLFDPETTKELLKEKELENSVAFLGDAAHPMSPFKGQGANQALLDASLLGHQVLSGLDSFFKKDTNPSRQSIIEELKKHVEVYHEKMSFRSRSKVQMSKDAVNDLHSPSAVAVGDICENSEAELRERIGSYGSITKYLTSLNITAQSAKHANLDELVIDACGCGSHPHKLHVDKIKYSRK
eukprot:maker-scaffold_13-snap-gene-9.53-mRNA-1 protein AED:0.21 eAED:0.24 QI:0/0/0/1/0/0/2/0/557